MCTFGCHRCDTTEFRVQYKWISSRAVGIVVEAICKLEQWQRVMTWHRFYGDFLRVGESMQRSME